MSHGHIFNKYLTNMQNYSIIILLSFQNSNVSRNVENFKKSRFMVVHGTGDGRSNNFTTVLINVCILIKFKQCLFR